MQQIFDRAIVGIVIARMTASAADAVFQVHVNQSVPETSRLVCTFHLRAKLDQFSSADAGRYGITRAQYDAWRAVHDQGRVAGVTSASASPAGQLSSRPASASVEAEDGDATAPDTLTTSATGQRHPSSAPKPSNPARPAPSEPSPAGADTADAGPDEPAAGSSRRPAARHRSSGSESPSAVGHLPTGSAGFLSALHAVFPWTRTPDGKLITGAVIGAAVISAPPLFHYSHWTALLWPALIVAVLVWGKMRRAASADPGQQTPDGGRQNLEPSNLQPATGPTGRLPSGRTRRLALFAALAAAVLIGAFVWLRLRQHPSASVVRAYLDHTFEPQPLRIAAIDVTSGSPTGAGSRVTFQGEVETTAPLYRRLVTSDWLGQKAPKDVTAILAADKLLHGPEAARLRAVAGDPPSPAISDLVLLTTQTAVGTPAPYSGTLIGWHHDAGWVFAPGAAGLPAPKFAGEPRAAGVGVFAVDDPADLARLQRLVADHAAYAAKLQTASTNLAADLARERQDRLAEFARLLRPGTLFTGVHTAPLRQTTEPVLIEIVSSTPETGRFDALLRNAGGWTDARHFDGQWTVSADSDRATVTLSTRSAQAVAHAGPLLEDLGDWSVPFELHPDGTVVTLPGNHQLQLTHVDPDAAGPVRDRYRKTLIDALGATAVGRTYRTVDSPDVGRPTADSSTQTPPAAVRPPSSGLLLRFTAQDAAAATIQVEVSSATDPSQHRTFHGTIVANTYRTGQWPIRLRSNDSERVKTAGQDTLLGRNTYNDGLVLELGLDGDRLVGDAGGTDYVFAVAAGVSPAVPSTAQTGRQTADGGGQPGSISAFAPSPAQGHPGSVTPPPSSGANPSGGPSTRDALRQHFSVSAFPTSVGAYALIDGAWTALPHNHGHTVKNTAVTGALGALKAAEDKLAGQGTTDDIPASSVLATIVFDGNDTIPTLSGTGLILAYVGTLKPMPDAILRSYPLLRDYPLMEMARTTTVNGHEEVRMIRIAPGIAAFGPTRIPATLETYGPLTLLRPTGPLAPGTYALTCGSDKYELRVKE